ncbi:cytochrome-c peroxidase [Myroides pelagicus]|uniref:Cytochrome-c peroxidase n=1 Tax=Myroides pelagicus TaxID=270914 RepID=A0A7K1GNT0_9FLAO|nr:cytochrome c peroxidase [Myroides pelagicus]MEC4114503.1 cytochrome c peroxidase [Myroides pelagicus]MTH30545.1 cytochrome-c peroxidase [Myroides pelagicus]
MRIKLVLLLGVGVFLSNCSTEDTNYNELDKEGDGYSFVVPTNFPELKYKFVNNEITKSGVELGKKLFHDPRLSEDNTVSCASCHDKKAAFSDRGKAFSIGLEGQVGKRNAPPIQNMAFNDEYFYDGASNNLEMVSIVPIHNPVEMRETLPTIMDKLRDDQSYQILFNKAYKDVKMTTTSMLKALAQYMTVLVSSNSKYDKYIRNEPGGELSSTELHGLTLYRQNCASCHATDLFTDNSFRNNGLRVNPVLDDKGRYEVTGQEEDKYAFKVSSLRNVAFTEPYMHDGRFKTLEEVIDFYRFSVQDSPTLDPLLKQSDGTLGIQFSEEEKKALLTFLETLTDSEFIDNPAF